MVYIRHMIRTQIYLPKSLYQAIDLVARRDKKPKAQVIREALEKGVKKEQKKHNAGKALLEFAELGKRLNLKGPTDLSTNHNKYYEEI